VLPVAEISAETRRLCCEELARRAADYANAPRGRQIACLEANYST
jgi:hypothetical protein